MTKALIVGGGIAGLSTAWALARRGVAVPWRQAVLYLSPPADMAAAWDAAPVMLDVQAEIGVYALPPRCGTRLKIGDHVFSGLGDPDGERGVPGAPCRAAGWLINACSGHGFKLGTLVGELVGRGITGEMAASDVADLAADRVLDPRWREVADAKAPAEVERLLQAGS